MHREILDATGRDVSIPAVYVTLNARAGRRAASVDAIEILRENEVRR